MYLDPGVWGAIVQVILGFVIGIPILLAVYWSRIKQFLAKRREKYEVREEDK